MATMATLDYFDWIDSVDWADNVDDWADTTLPDDHYISLAQSDHHFYCATCIEYKQDCTCTVASASPSFLHPKRDLFATFDIPTRPRYAARPPGKEMESSSGPGASASPAPPLPENPYTSPDTGGMTVAQPHLTGATEAQGLSLFDVLPFPDSYVDHFEASNIRESAAGHDVVAPDSDAAMAANILANGSAQAIPMYSYDNLSHGKALDEPFTQYPREIALTTAKEPHGEDEGYAKLTFGDGDFLIRTQQVVLGRNMDHFRQQLRQHKQSKRAAQELDMYRKEPSQPSQPGDEDQHGNPSNSSQSLEGRPAPPSNFSEHGGLVWHPDESAEAETHRVRPKRRVSHFSKSSSNNSIAPATLHPSMISNPSDPYNEATSLQSSMFIPIHPKDPEHIKKISKRHLLFSYNFQAERWELTVLGNRVLVNDEVFERGTVIPLEHNDEIQLTSVTMTFKLPDNCRRSPGPSIGTFSEYDGVADEGSEEDEDENVAADSASPVERLENAASSGRSASGEEDVTEEIPRLKKRGTVKVKPGKAKGKSAVTKKTAKPTKPTSKKQPKGEKKESPPKTAKKGVKPKGKEPAKSEKTGKDEESSSPDGAPFVNPNPKLANIPIDQLPERRKGPGRPPKNGNLSKRDLQAATKRLAEYEDRHAVDGQKIPQFNEILAEVRLEMKMKDAARKAAANGLPPPNINVMPSIEKDDATARTAPVTAGGEASASSDPPPKPLSPAKPRRVLSPVKPMEECTEEELTRPPRTYAVIIDEILREAPTGIADLQEIYERIQKKHPHYRYKVDSNGWQSSVRHNLQDVNRFTPAGKSGKGQLWKIDYNYPLDDKKKNKRTEPPKQRAAQNGQFAQGQAAPPPFGNSQYGNPYGQSQHHVQPPVGPQPGSGVYYSPYGQPGQHGQFQPGAPQGPPPNGAPQVGRYQQHPHQPPQQQPAASTAAEQVSPEHQRLISDLMPWIQQHLAQFAGNAAESQRQSDIVNVVINYLSEVYAGSPPSVATRAQVKTHDHQSIYGKLVPIFIKHKPDLVVPKDVWSDAEVWQAHAGSANDGKMSQTDAQPGSNGADSMHQQPAAVSQASETSQAPIVSQPEADSKGASSRIEGAQSPVTGSKRSAEDELSGPDPKRGRVGDA